MQKKKKNTLNGKQNIALKKHVQKLNIIHWLCAKIKKKDKQVFDAWRTETIGQELMTHTINAFLP